MGTWTRGKVGLLAVLVFSLCGVWVQGQDVKRLEQKDLADQISKAKPLSAIDVAEPVRSVRLSQSYLVPAGDGKNYHLVQFYFKQYGGPNTILIANLADGTMRQIQTERGYNLHLAGSVLASNGKLYISILDGKLRQQVCTYNAKTGEFKLNALPMPADLLGETHPIALGVDGKVYMGGGHTSKAAAVAQIDPATDQVKMLAPLGPSHEPSACWGYSVAADKTHVYIASGKVPWYLVAYDMATGKSETLLTTERVDGMVSVSQGPDGVTASASGVVGTDGKRQDFWLYQGKLVPRKDRQDNSNPPWPVTQTKSWNELHGPKPEISTVAAVPDSKGNAVIWYRLPEDQAKAPKSTVAKSKAAKAEGDEAPPESAPDDAQMEKEGWRALRFTIPTYPMNIYRLVEFPDGRLFGSAGSYEGMFTYDPKTGKSDHPGKIHLSHYATVQHDGKVYMSGYPSSPLYVYDPTKPWTANTRVGGTKLLDETDARSNPRRLTYLKDSGSHKMYTAAVGADGTIYMGGRWYRNGNHGGIGWWNPKTQESGGFWRDLSNYQVNFMTAADAGKTIVISAHRVDDTVLNKPKPEQGALFFLDHQTKKIVDKLEPMPKIKGPGPILAVEPNLLIGWTENPEDTEGKSSILYGVDVAKRQVVFTKILPVKLPVSIGSNQQERWDYRLGPDGRIWTFLDGKTLAAINPKDAQVQVIGSVSAGRIAFSGRDIYLSGTDAVRQIKNVLPAR